MTGGAGASAAVRIHAPNPTVRPGIRVKLAVFQILGLAAVTLPTAVCCSWTALHYLSQHVIQRAIKNDESFRTVLLFCRDSARSSSR